MSLTETFLKLTPAGILDAVEVGGRRATGRVVALNSMENRVYDVELEDGARVVAKFYRPGRWSAETILDEHRFLDDLAAEGVPVAAPLRLGSGPAPAGAGGPPSAEGSDNASPAPTLGQMEGILFALFPRVRGRPVEEPSEAELRRLGALLAQLHNVGARRDAPHRLRINPHTYGRQDLEFLEANQLVPANVWPRYREAAARILDAVEPRFEGAPAQRIHGDCHRGNLLWDGHDFLFVDFDDMLVGPPVQDVWLLTPGRDAEGQAHRQALLEGYEALREFDRDTLSLVEPLRAMRLIHYSAWIARRWEDQAFRRVFPHFGTVRYWQQETQDLLEQLSVILGLE
ncbi:MAG TPA: serine/threonine protein kinase [Candidatus Saccharimonadales bacterium]|nr:serine/threonine protein kinase [Candidatus Saccharimonadales bacterium]